MLKLKLHYFGRLMWRADSLKKTLMLREAEGQGRRGQQRMRWLDETTNSRGMSVSKLCDILMDTGAWRAAVGWVTEPKRLSNWTATTRWYTVRYKVHLPCYTPPPAQTHTHVSKNFLRLRLLGINLPPLSSTHILQSSHCLSHQSFYLLASFTCLILQEILRAWYPPVTQRHSSSLEMVTA